MTITFVLLDLNKQREENVFFDLYPTVIGSVTMFG